MKRYLFFLACLAALGACNSKKPCKQVESVSKIRIDGIKSDPISVKKASEMIENLLKEFRLERLVRERALGGYFLKSDFELQCDTCGVLLWYCLNEDGDNRYPKLFLAMEKINSFDTLNPANIKPGDSLIVPEDIFKYEKSSNDFNTVLASIIDHRTNTTLTPSRRYIKGKKVEEYSKSFVGYMKDIAPYRDTLYSKYPQAFFIRNTDYDNFISHNSRPRFIRYYFGLAWDADHKPNYLRPILAAVDSSGKTIVDKGIKSDDPFLQKSWPPPPNN